MSINPLQKNTHLKALALCQKHRELEWEIIQTLHEIDRQRVFRALGHSSLFVYAVEALGLSEAVAYAFINVARKSKSVPALAESLASRKLSVARAARLVSTITPGNAAELIEFACTHTSREVEFEVARLNPKAPARERVKAVGADMVELRVNLPKEVFEMIKRAQNLESKAKAKNVAETLAAALNHYLDRKDPVRRAERAQKAKRAKLPMGSSVSGLPIAPGVSKVPIAATDAKEPGPELCARKVPRRRVRLKAREKHAVMAKTKGRCTHIDVLGRRCTNERWVEIHHLTPVHQGGGNEPENLTVLCAFHHDLVHQLSLPVDGQISWLKSPVFEYRRAQQRPSKTGS
jgi:hypothetical protein